jgi:hypothetical protein
MALAAMASLANGGSGDGGSRPQLSSGSLCCRHHPVINVNGGGKDAIAATIINCCFHWQ